MPQQHTPDSVLTHVKSQEIESIWHWFVDLEGQIKGFSITPSELERSLEDGMHFDGSSVNGFNAIEESDLVARPDLSTFVELPDFGDNPRSVAYYCNIETPDGQPYDRDSRAVLRRVTE